ncbi:16S rRNA (guanine(527)-N(7))-methyltransferase RsmG [Malikia spinosa]|uniref:Ribosomal RNA small subunit methyltransferase G n=1 Tax=Malikia spinosa TaxID=86180 RepID=A0A2S9KIQ1_9BURK|nr:16S rRNA (guanine(527)-N(7))-methyltransferase RsmG [Malikia spinosa]MYZ52648.1 16S rRNA (guanine(527)-N(7))-methyltransferase RsmG [Malikia spinosa]PRD70310.1 16S rRNA (guanine(527)-N(7))-methyltransferase RsmG [Malikia spinosa]
MSAHPLETGLRAGIAELGLELNDEQVAKLLSYLDWVAKWNKVYNLTALRDPQEMLTHHLLDSLAAVAPLRRQLAAMGLEKPRLLDVGSGAGLPGAVFAIVCPELDVSCVDTVAKKALFIQQIAAALRLPNLHGLHARVENLKQHWDVVSSRAFASLADFTNWSRQALAEQGVWLAMKGKHPADEIVALAPELELFHVEQLQVPGLDAERCIVWVRPKAA